MRRIWVYLLLSFGISWAAWVAIYFSGIYSSSILYTAINALIMWAPALSVWLTGKLTGGGGGGGDAGGSGDANGGEKTLSVTLRPNPKGNKRWYLTAWLLPALAALLGALLYFCVFPKTFDGSLGYLRELTGQGGTDLGDQSLTVIVIAQIAGALTYGPFINMFFALGEEIGWRGFLFPELSKHTSKTKAHLLMGLIWGVWHTPINMMGHNYGIGYPGYPWAGIIAMCVFTFSAGVLLSWLTEKSKSIWPAALGHGSINAAAGIPALFLSTEVTYNQLLGPMLSGLIAGIPLLILAVIVLLREKKSHTN